MKKTDEEKEYLAILANVREITKTRQGVGTLWHILGMCDIYSDTFTGDNRTFYLEGKRAVALQILQLLEDADPTLYARMLLENQKRKEVRSSD